MHCYTTSEQLLFLQVAKIAQSVNSKFFSQLKSMRRALPKNFPPAKKKELAQIVKIIRAQEKDVAMIILFGSYSRGDYKEEKDLKPQRWSGHVSDYDILVVTAKYETVKNQRKWGEIQNKLLAENLTATPRIIAHDITEINAMLSVDQYFFHDIKEEGVLLFNSGKLQLSEAKKLTEKEQKTIARAHFNDRFKKAKNAFSVFENCFRVKDYNWSAFMLHQAAEGCYKTILLVFTNYCPDEHYLSRLSLRTAKYIPEIVDIFKGEASRFHLLDKAYIGARYIPSSKPFKYPPPYVFDINKEDLKILAPRIKKLLALTKTFCQKKIAD